MADGVIAVFENDVSMLSEHECPLHEAVNRFGCHVTLPPAHSVWSANRASKQHVLLDQLRPMQCRRLRQRNVVVRQSELMSQCRPVRGIVRRHVRTAARGECLWRKARCDGQFDVARFRHGPCPAIVPTLPLEGCQVDRCVQVVDDIVQSGREPVGVLAVERP